MRQRLTGFVTSTKNKWNELDRAARIKVILAAAAVILALGALVFYVAKPRMVTVLTGLSHIDGMDGIGVLATAGISAEFEDGSLKVREADADRASYELARSDVTALNRPDTSFPDAMDLLSMGQTSAIQRDVMINQTKRELEYALQMFDGVTSAIVTIHIADDSRAFLRSEQKSSLSVVLNTNKDISAADGQAMARFLCKSIKGLTMEEIEITNQNYQTIYSGTKMSADGYSEVYDLELMKKNEMTQMVKGYVAGMYSDVSVLVNLDMNSDRVVEQMRRYQDPNPSRDETGFATSEYYSQSSVTGGDTGADPGIGANDQIAPDYQMGGDTPVEAKTKEEQIQSIYDEIFSETEYAIGAINYANSSLSVRLTNQQIYYEENLTDYVEQQGLPEDTTWQQFKMQTEEFMPNPVDEEITNLRESISNGTGIPYDNTKIDSYTQSVFIDLLPEETSIQSYVMFGVLALLILLLLYGFIKKTPIDEVTEVEPELSVEGLLVSTQLEEEKEAEVAKLAEIAFSQESEAMRQIEAFIEERPEAVAQLLRNWINEDWE